MYYTDLTAIPTGRYHVIYADPCWTYKDKALAGHRGAGCHYPLLTDQALQALPIRTLTTPDALCFMWVTMPKLAEGLALMAAWGFTYKTVAFTWVKRNRRTPTWFWGMGRWTRANAELVLLGTKGHPQRASASVHSVLDDPLGPHSRKPDTCRTRIEKLVPPTYTKLELFARGGSVGWDSWGNTPEWNPDSQ